MPKTPPLCTDYLENMSWLISLHRGNIHLLIGWYHMMLQIPTGPTRQFWYYHITVTQEINIELGMWHRLHAMISMIHCQFHQHDLQCAIYRSAGRGEAESRVLQQRGLPSTRSRSQWLGLLAPDLGGLVVRQTHRAGPRQKTWYQAILFVSMEESKQGIQWSLTFITPGVGIS